LSEIQLCPYVNFQGRAREAMEFYQKALGGNLSLQTVGEQGVTKPAGPEDSIAYARLEADGVLIIGVDGHPSYPPTVGENMALALAGTDKDHLTQIFFELAEGGKVKMPPTVQPSGSEVGWFVDKFGINWMVTIDKE
jgi:PhnB protein